MAAKIKHAAVLGAGVMGTGIATHLAGMGIKTLLLDMVPKASGNDAIPSSARNSLPQNALKQARKARPPVFHDLTDSESISVGNFDDDFERIGQCDWIVEVVVERTDIKKAILEKVDRYRKTGSIVTSNTSGLDIEDLTAGRSDDFKKHFCVSHFFNPVRFMRLLELVPAESTDPQILHELADFGSDVLGKGIVYGKNTANFIANRIGVYSLMHALHNFQSAELSIEEVDAAFGPVLGRPKSAVFRTADIVGIDVLVHVATNCYESLSDDECRNTFLVPNAIREMVSRGLIGQKVKQGFYSKKGKEILAVDLDNFTYRPKSKVRVPSIGAVKSIDDVAKRIQTFLRQDDTVAKFAWDVTAHTLVYSANRIGEICDDIVNCDRAMRWGFNWDLGPFEMWDALGVAETAERIARSGLRVPAWVSDMLERGQSSFYGGSISAPTYYDVKAHAVHDVPQDEKHIRVAALNEQGKVIEKNAGAALLDMGDGILLFEARTKMGVVDGDVGAMLNRVVDLAEEQEWTGVVVGNDHKTAFCAGANLFAVMVAINQNAWNDLEQLIVGFQNANMRLRYSDIPVVAAPAGLALGGGAEIVMGADAVRAHIDLFMGLVEVGVGLIPAAGGCLRMLERFCGVMPDDPGFDPLPHIQEAFKLIAMATVSTGAQDARRLRMLRPHDAITANRDRLLHDAKETALGLARAGYRQPKHAKYRLPGANGAANLRWFVDNLRRGKQVSDHDYTIASKVAWVLCGGDTNTRNPVDEQYILDLEREAFLSLAGEPKSQARIQHMLTAKRPLRN